MRKHYALCLGPISLFLVAFAGEAALAQNFAVAAHSDQQNAIALGSRSVARNTVGTVQSSRINTLRIRARADDTLALSAGWNTRAYLEVASVGQDVRANSVSLNASVDDAAALSFRRGTARITVGSACRARGGHVATNAHVDDVVALNVGFWTPLPSRVNIGSVGCR